MTQNHCPAQHLNSMSHTKGTARVDLATSEPVTLDSTAVKAAATNVFGPLGHGMMLCY